MIESFNIRIIIEYLPMFLQGLGATAWISLISMAFALFIAIFACTARLSGVRVLSIPAIAYIEIIRSTPLLAQLYFFYFGLPELGIQLTETQTGILALSLNSGGYIAEIIRAGILSVTKGQIEAAKASGFNLFQRLWYIILPQAIGITIPALLGQVIVLVKDSSLLALISVMELTRAGQLMASDRFMPTEGFFTTAAFYLLLKGVCVWWQKRLIHQTA